MKPKSLSRQGFLRATGAGLATASLPASLLRSPQRAQAASGTISVFTEAGSTWTAFMKAKAALFKQAKGITVNFVEVAYSDMYTKAAVALSTGGTSYDVMMMPEWIIAFSSAGLLEPLDDVINSDARNDIFPAALQKVSYQGHFYGVPLAQSCEALYYRTDLLRDAGIAPPTLANPWSWDQYLSAAVKLTKPPSLYGTSIKAAKYPIAAMQYSDISYQGGNGVDGVFDRDRHVVVDSPNGLAAMNYYVSL